MIQSLILVRHAKTEPRAADLDDSARQLTLAGIRSAKAFLPRALGLVENPHEYRIWSSPATRAWQTAEIVADALGLSKIEKRPELYTDEVAALRQRLNAEEGHIILVGHNPYLEEFAENLDSAHLHFGKSAVACYTFPDQSFASAELAWFVQGPDSSRWETIVEMETGLQRAARKSSGAAWSFFDDPKNPERLEELRDSLRRCLAMVEFARPYLKRGQYRRLHDTMEDFYDDTTKLKHLTLTNQTPEQWASIPFVTSEAQRVYDRLRVLETERNRIIAKLQTPSRQKALHEASQELRSIAWKSRVKSEGIERSDLRRRLKKMKRELHEAQEAQQVRQAAPGAERTPELARKLVKQEQRLGYIADGYAPLFKKDHDSGNHAAK